MYRVSRCSLIHRTTRPGLREVDSISLSPAPLSSSSLLRYPSFIRAVYVDALVRTCAGGISDGRPYLDRNSLDEYLGVAIVVFAEIFGTSEYKLALCTRLREIGGDPKWLRPIVPIRSKKDAYTFGSMTAECCRFRNGVVTEQHCPVQGPRHQKPIEVRSG